MKTENMTELQYLSWKAMDSAEAMVDDLRDFHSKGCEDKNQLLEILLLDLIQDAAKIQAKLARINAAIE